MGLALLLALSRRAVAADRACRAGDWWGFRERVKRAAAVAAREEGGGGCRLVYNSSVLVIGHGAVGRHVSRVLRAMGSRVVATRRTLAEKEGRMQNTCILTTKDTGYKTKDSPFCSKVVNTSGPSNWQL